MSYLSCLPFGDYYQGVYPHNIDSAAYNPCFKTSYNKKPTLLKGVKKIQSLENINNLMVPPIARSAINNNANNPELMHNQINNFKKINSVDNFIPEDIEFNLDQFYANKDKNHELNTLNDSNSLKNKKKVASEADFRIKYKTEVCKYWATYQYCQFGDQCAFAHGKEEIREKIHISTNYKTKKCIQFHANLYCPYGQRCQFLHSWSNIKKDHDLEENFSYVNEMENLDHLSQYDNDCFCCTKRPRLPIFASITRADILDKVEKILNNIKEQGSTRSCSEITSDTDDSACLDSINFINQSSSD